MQLIPLSQGLVAQVDDVDYVYLSQWKWYAAKDGKTYYARRATRVGERPRVILMHRVIACAVDGQEVDHKDLDGLNNTRANIRIATHAGNTRNRPKQRGELSSSFKGVVLDRSRAMWKAQIKVNGRSINLGRFASEDAAARAYDAAARRHFGQFARTNF